ncbi:MAG: hypothetical protein AAGF11_44490 [Myxococcota bacterium]
MQASSPMLVHSSKPTCRSGLNHPEHRPRSARALGGLLVAVLTIAGPTATVRAAPAPADEVSTESELPDAECDATPSLDEAKLMTARDLYARGEESFKRGDYLGTVEAWEQVLVLMPDNEATLRVQLAHAHRGAYRDDDDIDHLRSARALFNDQLSSLSADDAAREDLEAEIAEIDATFAALEAARAKAQAERDEAIRQEQILRNQQALAAAEAEHQRNIQKIYYGVGGSLTGLGLGSLAAMTALLVRGAQTDRQGQETASMTDLAEGRYRDLLAEGERYNRAAVATGIVGGVLTLSGASLLVVAAIRHKRVVGLTEDKVAVVPAVGGVRVRF